MCILRHGMQVSVLTQTIVKCVGEGSTSLEGILVLIQHLQIHVVLRLGLIVEARTWTSPELVESTKLRNNLGSMATGHFSWCVCVRIKKAPVLLDEISSFRLKRILYKNMTSNIRKNSGTCVSFKHMSHAPVCSSRSSCCTRKMLALGLLQVKQNHTLKTQLK